MRTFLDIFADARRIDVQARTVVLLVTLQLVASAFELVGLASFLPIFQYLNNGGDIAKLSTQDGIWKHLVAVSEQIGIVVTLPKLLLATLGILLVRQALTFTCAYYEFQKRESAIAMLRARLFSAFLRASSNAQDSASSGGMVNDMTYNSLRAAQHVFSRFTLANLLTILTVYCVGMLMVNARLTMVLLGIILLSGMAAAPYILRARKFGKNLVAANKKSADFVIERLRLARIVRLSRMEGIEADAINQLSFAQRHISVGIWRTLGIVDALLETLAVSAAMLFIFIATTYLGVAVEVIGLMIAMLLRLVPVVRQIARTKQFADAARGSYDAVVRRIATLDASRELQNGGVAMTPLRSGIEYRKVTFKYPSRPDAPAVSEVSIRIPYGRLTAIVGPSGSGKSTLIDLLPRLRDPDEGEILVDGVSLRHIELGSLRRATAFVPQSPLLFDVPLGEHIRYGTPDAELEEVRRAAKLAGAAQFIEALPQGYDTRAGEGGRLLSGGQRQRLELARAMLARAQILILDEPTTGLDQQSVRYLLDALDRIRRETDTTIVMVTHDLQAVTDADQIIVMAQGRVEAVGTHEEVLRASPWYASASRGSRDRNAELPAT